MNVMRKREAPIIEKEIETVLRENHTEHFKWFSRKLNTPLTKDLPSWKDFIEATERRNLFVHNGGIVNQQYLDACKDADCVLEPEVILGHHLPVTKKYFNQAYSIFYEIGVKLALVLWRRLLPTQLDGSDTTMINIIFDLIFHGKYDLALSLSTFATQTCKTHSSAETQLILLINHAQAQKWKGDQTACIATLDSFDWSASGDNFKLAVAVLRDDFVSASELMKKIGAADKTPTQKVHYREWPLFRKFRHSPEFKAAYKELYDEEFASREEREAPPSSA